MAFQRPTLKELNERTEQDVTSRVGISAPARLAVLRVLSRALAGLAHGLYGYIDIQAKNLLPDTGDANTVLRWAQMLGVQRQAASQSSGDVTASGIIGSVVPAGSLLQSSDGAQFEAVADVTFAGATATISVQSIQSGAANNVDTGQTVSFVSPIAGVTPATTVLAPGITGGADEESIDDLRVRVLERMRQPPKGGAESDYVQWAKEGHPDVTRAWVSGQEMSANSVTVRIVTDDAPGGMIPSAGVIDDVEAYIEDQRPVTAVVYVVAPTAVPLDMSIAISPNTQAVKDAITAELQDMLKRDAEPGGTILISRINEAISIATGEGDHSLISPVANVTHTTGQIATLGTITWSSL